MKHRNVVKCLLLAAVSFSFAACTTEIKDNSTFLYSFSEHQETDSSSTFSSSCTSTDSSLDERNNSSSLYINTYTVTWVDWDGVVLKRDTDVIEGTFPHYDGIEPFREPGTQYTYTFEGWSPNVVSVSQDVTYTAQYSRSKAHYTVTWNVNGDLLSEDYVYGETPVFKGDTTKPSDAQYVYNFIGWSPDVSAVTENAVYTAKYESYSLAFEKYDDVFHIRNDLYSDFSMVEEHDYDFVEYDDKSEDEENNWKYVFTCKKCGHVFKETSSLISRYTISDGYVTILGINPVLETTIVIPPIIAGFPVKILGDIKSGDVYRPFASNKHVKQVWLPQSIEQIGMFAFGSSLDGCTKIESLNIPSGMSSIGKYSLSGLNNGQNLKHLTISSSFSETNSIFVYGFENLEYKTYDNCCYLGFFDNPYYALVKVEDKSLFNYEIHPNCKMLCDNAFNNCKNLVSIDIPNGVHTIEKYVFAGCEKLKNIKLPDSLRSLSVGTFHDCSALEEIIIPEGLETIESRCVWNCQSLSKMIIPLSVKVIGSYAIQKAPNLTIYCIAKPSPSTWESNWFSGVKAVLLGYTGD